MGLIFCSASTSPLAVWRKVSRIYRRGVTSSVALWKSNALTRQFIISPRVAGDNRCYTRAIPRSSRQAVPQISYFAKGL